MLWPHLGRPVWASSPSASAATSERGAAWALGLGAAIAGPSRPSLAHSTRNLLASECGRAVALSRALPSTHYVPVALLITAVIFAVTATPTFLWLRERATPRPAVAGISYLKAGFARVRTTLRHAAQLRDLFRFLAAAAMFS